MKADLDQVLPRGVERQHGAPPAPPVDFEDNYVLPVHSEKPLQVLHTHPLDSRLVFYEEPHVYTLDGVPTSGSVTSLAHDYEVPFDARAAIDLMKRGRSQAWPRVEYVTGAAPLEEATGFDATRGALLVRGGKTVSVLYPHTMRLDTTLVSVKELLVCACADTPGSESTADDEFYTYERVMTDAEIEKGWKKNGSMKSKQGTEGHYQCELFLNGLPCRWWEGELSVLFDFVRRHLLPRGIVIWNTEKEIVCVDADLGGSIDAILYDPSTDLHHILDFKRAAKLASEMRGYSKMCPPMAHLDSCKGAAYALQVGIYQYILERDYGMKIGDRILLSIYPDAPFATSVPYLHAEVDYIMRRRMEVVRARRAAVAENPDFACALCGAPVVDAVRLEDGRVAMEKAALVKNVAFAPAQDIRTAFAQAVKSVETPVDPPTPSECVSWKRRMPTGGIVPFA